jgi:hypothetical protein
MTHREIQLLALVLKLGKLWDDANPNIGCYFSDYPLKRIRNQAAFIKITLTDSEILEAEKYLRENKCL